MSRKNEKETKALGELAAAVANLTKLVENVMTRVKRLESELTCPECGHVKSLREIVWRK